MSATGPETYLRLRKQLNRSLPAAVWPAGIRPEAFDTVNPRLLHALLDECFPGGLIAVFGDWYGNLTSDAEFDPALCVPALTEAGDVAGFVQCWTSGFVKDLAIAPGYRDRGLGAALMLHAFALFAARGAPHVDLKSSWRKRPRAGFMPVSACLPSTSPAPAPPPNAASASRCCRQLAP